MIQSWPVKGTQLNFTLLLLLQVLLACFFAVAVAAPQQDQRPIALFFDERSDSGDGNFAYNFETENGIAMDVSGTPGNEGQSNMQGVFR